MPTKQSKQSNVLPEVTVTAIRPTGGTELKRFIRGVNFMRTPLMKQYNLTDKEWAYLSKLGVDLTGIESTGGKGKNYNLRKFIPDDIIHLGKKWIRGNDQPNSRGLSQIKIWPNDTELNAQYSRWGINDSNLGADNFKQGLATMLKLMDIRSKKEPTYTWSDGTTMSDDAVYNAFWNRGKLTSGLNDKNDLNYNSIAGRLRKYNRSKILK